MYRLVVERGRFRPGLLPSFVFVELLGEDLSFEAELAPDYSATFPNGPECPECRRGTIMVDIE
ncbi:MAG: hypothetical protein ACRD21_27665 [Vicinamibacteria bacterium]